jgi:diguanylate cyclase (GGDEF)-like protein/PAS domain S-box-containing protein
MNRFITKFQTAFDDLLDHPQRILIVDDERRMRASLKLLINSKGREILECETGNQAISILGTQDISLVLLDINLPDISGLEVLEWITSHKLPTSVIMVSAVDDINYAISALRNGAMEFVRKPEELQQIQHKVENVLYRRRLERTNSLMTAKLEQSERLHRFMIESSPDIIYTLDNKGRFVFINKRIETLLGYSKEELIGAPYISIVHEEDQEKAYFAFNERRSDERCTTNLEVRLKCKTDDSYQLFEQRHVVAMLSSMGIYEENQNGELAKQRFLGTYGVARDITERKVSEEIISYQALHDQLTQLPNRRLYYDHLDLAITQSKRHGTVAAVMFIDLDRFKLVNDTYGHAEGDELLKNVARRLHQCVRACDTLARQGGDEFTVLLPNLSQPEDAAIVARKILDELRLPFTVAGQEFCATASIGIAVYPRDGETADILMKNADIAMYKVKACGKNGFQFFAAEMNACYHERISLENELRQAIARSELELFYQPKIDVVSNQIVGMEALIRWWHPVHGLLNPGSFIFMAEESGLASSITNWVLSETCRRIACWQDLGYSISISVNVSPKDFEREDLVDCISANLNRYGVNPSLLEIEITENMMLSGEPRVLNKMQQIRDRGVRISIDDFGTGYSSLNYLRQFPINTIKIDQSFIRDLVIGQPVSPIIHAIIGVAHGFGLHLVAEGVETVFQMETLREMGCYEMQGYLFSRPVQACDAELMLSQYIVKSAELSISAGRYI